MNLIKQSFDGSDFSLCQHCSPLFIEKNDSRHSRSKFIVLNLRLKKQYLFSSYNKTAAISPLRADLLCICRTISSELQVEVPVELEYALSLSFIMTPEN